MKNQLVSLPKNHLPNFRLFFCRFKEDVGDIVPLRQKEKGDWKKISTEEKKQLYRASFCQTLTEAEAPTGEWKSVSIQALCNRYLFDDLFFPTKVNVGCI